MSSHTPISTEVSGTFVTLGNERYYAIRNVDRMAPFFISVVSGDDHWLFASSTGGLTAGRVMADHALFPYITDDKIHDSAEHTGSKTIVRITGDQGQTLWEPFNRYQTGCFNLTRNLYKHVLGHKLCFEEINHDLQLVFRYTWSTSAEFGFVRDSELQNLADSPTRVEIIDGLQNILPAGTPAAVQASSSNLVNAYKWNELDPPTGLACITLYSGISDRAEPCESLKATTVFSLGLVGRDVLLSSEQLDAFREGVNPHQETTKRGVRGAYLVSFAATVQPSATEHWRIVANVEQSQGDAVVLRQRLADPASVDAAIDRSVNEGSDALARIMASADGFQSAGPETETTHHYANVLFNVMRGGIFHDQYNLPSRDFAATLKHFNKQVYERSRDLLDALPEKIRLDKLLELVAVRDDSQLERLTREYLPLTFGRRHGDPSRPWNRFEIKIKNEDGSERLSYQGNWRDIFQNWEALTFSYPHFIDNVIAKFVNASTADGYNPYRIGKDGIDWEIEEPDDPWSYIGYWGDHQIIYLLKLLELSRAFNPSGLHALLRKPIFSYANVPYRIKPFDDLVKDPKSTVTFDDTLADAIDKRVAGLGADGKLLPGPAGSVLQVNLLEKLLGPLLAKLGNLVVDGGVWLNTQRPEWNDANNALVGYGLSMVTLYYMRRYVQFMRNLLADETEHFDISAEVAEWISETATALARIRRQQSTGHTDDRQRFAALKLLGEAAGRYRARLYARGTLSAPTPMDPAGIRNLLVDALEVIDRSIDNNRRDDGLYHAYNLIDLRPGSARVDRLYPMLEGQVAALSSGNVAPTTTIEVVEALFRSAMYRPDQNSFTLYPDRELPGFFEKNRFPSERAEAIPTLARMLDAGDRAVVYLDADGWCRFNPNLVNAGALNEQLDRIASVSPAEANPDRNAILDLYEDVFQHRAFTGRSGTMFGYEGLGSIYWHMVSKLLLAVQENFFAACEEAADDALCLRLGELYYRVRDGLGFNKTPAEYGAFPTDPYSHTPKHAGASQPGMTGQVKEEVLTRFGELGIRIRDGKLSFFPRLLRPSEFRSEPAQFRFMDVDGIWQELHVPAGALAFTWCQVPFIYRLAENTASAIVITDSDGIATEYSTTSLPQDVSSELFGRTGRFRQVVVNLSNDQLFRG